MLVTGAVRSGHSGVRPNGIKLHCSRGGDHLACGAVGLSGLRSTMKRSPLLMASAQSVTVSSAFVRKFECRAVRHVVVVSQRGSEIGRKPLQGMLQRLRPRPFMPDSMTYMWNRTHREFTGNLPTALKAGQRLEFQNRVSLRSRCRRAPGDFRPSFRSGDGAFFLARRCRRQFRDARVIGAHRSVRARPFPHYDIDDPPAENTMAAL